MLLPIEKGKVYCTKVEPDVLFRYGDFLIKNPNNTVKNCNRIDKYNHHPIRQCNQAKHVQIFILFGHYLDMRIYTAMIYRHVLKQGGQDVVSSLGR
jgi:hypothetical protein